MAGFTIPNTPDSYNQNQAEPDSLDFQILGNHKNAVISGLEVTPGPSGATVAVSAGEVLVDGVYHTYAGSSSVSLTAYVSSPFFDVVVARLSSGSISVVVLSGTSGANPVYPTIASTDVVLAAVWRPSSATPDPQMIVDKRLLVPSSANRTSSGAPTGGSTGDTHVNTAWTAGANLASPFSVKVGSTWYNLAYWPSSGNFSAGTITANLIGNVTGNVSGSAGSVAWSNISGVPSLVYNNGGTYSINITGNAGTAGYASSAGNANYASSSGSTGVAQYIGSTNTDSVPDPKFGYSVSLAGYYAGSNLTVASKVDANEIILRTATTSSGSAVVRTSPSGYLRVQASLRELKKDIQDIEDALTVINSLRPRKFHWITREDDEAYPINMFEREAQWTHGFVVEEIAEVDTDLLHHTVTDPNGTKFFPHMWKSNDLIALLTRSVQQLSDRLDALEAK